MEEGKSNQLDSAPGLGAKGRSGCKWTNGGDRMEIVITYSITRHLCKANISTGADQKRTRARGTRKKKKTYLYSPVVMLGGHTRCVLSYREHHLCTRYRKCSHLYSTCSPKRNRKTCQRRVYLFLCIVEMVKLVVSRSLSRTYLCVLAHFRRLDWPVWGKRLDGYGISREPDSSLSTLDGRRQT